MKKCTMSDCMCNACDLAAECWNIYVDDEVVTNIEKANELAKEDKYCCNCKIDSNCSKCSCYDECCERE